MYYNSLTDSLHFKLQHSHYPQKDFCALKNLYQAAVYIDQNNFREALMSFTDAYIDIIVDRYNHIDNAILTHNAKKMLNIVADIEINGINDKKRNIMKSLINQEDISEKKYFLKVIDEIYDLYPKDRVQQTIDTSYQQEFVGQIIDIVEDFIGDNSDYLINILSNIDIEPQAIITGNKYDMLAEKITNTYDRFFESKEDDYER